MNKKIIESLFFFLLITIILLSTSVTSAAENVTSTEDTTDLVQEEAPVTVEENKEIIENSEINEEKTVKDNDYDTYSNNTTSEKTIVKVNLTDNQNTKTSGVMEIPLDKSRKIYFAMDHTSSKDKTICNNVVKTLKNAGFNVVRYTIGPNAMYQNMLYLYNHNIKNAIMFHLYNGVDPSSIKEVGTNGNDNRGRIVRKRGNDVVLAWFYDAADCVHSSGSAYKSVRGSETSGRLYNPKSYMDKNKIYYICTSSDSRRHKSTADYTGVKTAQEFIKLFYHDTTTKVTKTTVNNAVVTITGTVTSKYASNINGVITVKDQNSNVLKSNVKVTNGKFTDTVTVKNSGSVKLTLSYGANGLNRASSTTATVNIPKNVTISVKQVGNTVDNTILEIELADDKSKKAETGRVVYVKFSNGTIAQATSNSYGKASIRLNSTKSEDVIVYVNDGAKVLNQVNKKVTVNKNNVIITVDEVIGTIGESITLNAYLRDENGKAVNGGNIVFKLNGRTLRVDKRFDSDADPLKFNVVNGFVSVKLTADLYLRNAKNLTVSYSGSYKYNANKSGVVTAQIRKRYANVSVVAKQSSLKNSNIIELQASLKDTTPKGTNSTLLSYKSYVMFKVNGRTLKKADGSNMLVKVGSDNVARYNYTFDYNGLKSTKTYTIEVVFTCDNYYPDSRNTTMVTVKI